MEPKLSLKRLSNEFLCANIKYEIKESKIERGISKIDIVTKLGSWANSSYRAANR